MSRYPGATWRPVDRYRSGPLKVPMTPRRLVFHTAVSNATPSMHSFFNVDGRATPHFYVGRDGEVEQYIDTDFRGSANLEGNWNVIGVETWDGFGATWNGGGEGPHWTTKQVAALAALAVWCAKEHGIPLDALRTSRRLGRGVGFHRLGIDGNFPSTWPLRGRVAGGEHWSSSFGKVCPTNTRIKQTVNEVLPTARKIAVGRTQAKPQPEPEVSHAEVSARELRKAIKAMRKGRRRWKLRSALRLIRDVIGTKKHRQGKTLVNEVERRSDEDRNERRPHDDSNRK